MSARVPNRHLPAAAETNGDWRNSAACLHEDPELFFPIGETGPAMLQIHEAKDVCRTCPVVTPCLRFALHTSQDTGVWGGQSETDRRKLKRRIASAPHEIPTDQRGYAIELFHTHRGDYATDAGTIRAISHRLDGVPYSAVRLWLVDAGIELTGAA